LPDSSFTLHNQLAKDSSFIIDLDLCRAQLINDSNYPWVILVPRIAGATEIHKLDHNEQSQLLLESAAVCRTMESLFAADKMNVAAIGNMVPQLHLHHVARYRNDIAWPAPVWGFASATPYDSETLRHRIDAIQTGVRSLIQLH